MYTTISWCIEAGITSKMIRETQVVMREAGFNGNYWVKPKTLGHQQLYSVHILPAIILIVSGLGATIIIFISEMIYHRCRVKFHAAKVTTEGNPRQPMKNDKHIPMDDMGDRSGVGVRRPTLHH